MSSVEIHHPYGMVGRLPWMDRQGVAYGAARSQPSELIRIAGALRTFSEGTDSNGKTVWRY